MKKCPRCGSTLHDEAKFCSECGYSFIHKGKRRFWKEQKFENCTIQAVADWLRAAGGRYEIISIRAGIRYADKGFILTYKQYYFTYCSIRYYDDAAAKGHHYFISYNLQYDGLFTSAQEKVNRELAKRRPAYGKELLRLRRESFVEGGGKICGGIDIFEV